MNAKRLSEVAARMRGRAQRKREYAASMRGLAAQAWNDEADWLYAGADEIEAALAEGGDGVRSPTLEQRHIIEQVIARGQRNHDLNPTEVLALEATLTGPTLTQAHRDFFEAARSASKHRESDRPDEYDASNRWYMTLLDLAGKQDRAYRAMLAEEETPK